MNTRHFATTLSLVIASSAPALEWGAFRGPNSNGTIEAPASVSIAGCSVSTSAVMSEKRLPLKSPLPAYP